MSAAMATNEPIPMSALPGHVLMFVDGDWMPSMSTMPAPQAGVRVTSVEGVVVHVAKDVTVHAPIHCVFVMTPEATASQPRVMITAEARSHITVFESYVGIAGASAYQVRADTQVVLAENASVAHVCMHRESNNAEHVSQVTVQQARHSQYTSHVMSLGGKHVEHTINVQLQGEEAACTLYSLYTGDGQSRIDQHTHVLHAAPATKSRQVYKGIVNGMAICTFQGKVIVQSHAQHTDASQKNKNLVLSHAAMAHTRPELEIYADDVKCAHGATVGQLDEHALFYMRSRGIGLGEARRKLTMAFASDVMDSLPAGPHSALVLQWCQQHLDQVCAP